MVVDIQSILDSVLKHTVQLGVVVVALLGMYIFVSCASACGHMYIRFSCTCTCRCILCYVCTYLYQPCFYGVTVATQDHGSEC